MPEGVAYNSSRNILKEDSKEPKSFKDKIDVLDSKGHLTSAWITERHWNTHPNFFAAETGWNRTKGGRVESIGHKVFLATSLVGEYLELAVGVIYGYSSNTEYPWPEPLLISLRLTSAGWCSSEIKNLSKRSSLTYRYYLSSMDRRSLGKDHRACCYSYCLANQVDEATYKTKHVVDGCNCESERFVLIAQSGLPDTAVFLSTLLVVQDEGNDGEAPTWTSCMSGENGEVPMKYVAISHVWADGRGNPTENSLPRCQLRYIQNAVNELYENIHHPVPFWIDTLCVPLLKPLRKLAIRQMQKIYREADKVLVLDASVECSTIDANPEECLTRIQVSPWMQRLWTLQEGAFAMNLYFRFKEKSVMTGHLQLEYRLQRLRDDAQRYTQLDNNSPMKHVLGHFIASMKGIDLEGEPTTTEYLRLRLEDIYFSSALATGSISFFRCPTEGITPQSTLTWLSEQLQFRATSKAEDEVLCIATILGIDTLELLEFPEPERSSIMYSLIGRVPADIIFHNRPRLRIDITPTTWIPSWIPSTFLNVREICQSEKVGEVHSFGLRVTYPGTRLSGATAAKLKSKFEIFQESSKKHYVVNLIPPRDYVGDSRGISQLAIILEESLVSLESKRAPIRGLLVLVLREEDRGILCRLFRPVTVSESNKREGESHDHSVTAGSTTEELIWFIA